MACEADQVCSILCEALVHKYDRDKLQADPSAIPNTILQVCKTVRINVAAQEQSAKYIYLLHIAISNENSANLVVE